MQLSRMCSLRNIRRYARAIAVLALCAWLGVDAADAAHRLTVRHVACNDHAGELAELSAHAGEHVHGELDAATLCSEAPAEGHGHDHCRLVLTTLAPLPRLPARALAPLPSISVALVAILGSPPHVSARWRVAPKTSPPV